MSEDIPRLDQIAPLIARHKAEQKRRIAESLAELVARLVGHRFTLLSAGAPVDARVRLFIPPREDETASVDVVFADGAHLEIRLSVTGWGSPVRPDEPEASLGKGEGRGP